MNGSGKAGNGNNRRRPKRRNKDHHSRQDGSASGSGGTPRSFSGDAQKPKDRSFSENQRHQDRNPQPRAESSQRAKGGQSGWKDQRAIMPYRSGFTKKGKENYNGKKIPHVDRPKWVPPKISTDPLPVPDCHWCGKPIKDISFAISDRDTGAPVHFECVAERLTEGEILEKGDTITYIGGGRFGVVCFNGSGNSSPANRNFKIKKVIEWENKEERAEWRSLISDRYSIS